MLTSWVRVSVGSLLATAMEVEEAPAPEPIAVVEPVPEPMAEAPLAGEPPLLPPQVRPLVRFWARLHASAAGQQLCEPVISGLLCGPWKEQPGEDEAQRQ